MVAIEIPPDRLERYLDFVSRHSDNSIYNPERGIQGLLSVLTPDPKGVILWSMADGEAYFNARHLHQSVLTWMERIGLPKATFPLSYGGIWVYCEQRSNEGEIVDGSLVDIGAVVKDVYETTPQGLKTGYSISPAGNELARPLILNAMEFVYMAEESSTPHTYDSMWKIFGAVNSRGEKRRQLAVFDIIRFLIENPTGYRRVDISDALKGRIDDGVVSSILNSLGSSGLIHYESGYRDVHGKRTSWTKSVAKPNELSRMLYDIVLLPAFELANTLNVPPKRRLEPEKVRTFLENYSKERTHIGSQGGEEVKSIILSLLGKEKRKLSSLVEEGNEKIGRSLHHHSYLHQLKILMEEGLVERPTKGYYRLRSR